ncbi:MAG TPA: serine/threonine-protein kinase, partial [Polyangia bacterium]|nr:serine/threonine-protein kinase [Polyangia bacterium]
MQFDQRSGRPGPLEPGGLFNSGSEYRLVERLGRGGMGEVWKAERRSAGGQMQKVAVKFLADSGGAAALDVEALRMSLLSHDNIVPFVDSGCDQDGRFFVAMTFVEGMDLDGLRRMIELDGEAAYQVGRATVRVPEQIVGFVLFMVLRALEYAHTFDFGGGVVGLVHRDISPGNILLDERLGFVKLSDFGVAVVSGDAAGQRQIAGKVPYMAPEVLIGDLADARSDLYSLGLVAYELATGFNPNVRPAVL